MLASTWLLCLFWPGPCLRRAVRPMAGAAKTLFPAAVTSSQGKSSTIAAPNLELPGFSAEEHQTHSWSPA